jgi:PAS domain S-box-containing protein
VHTKGNGKPFLAQVRLSITNVNGKDLLFTSWRDITKQKETEEEMRKFRIISDQANYGSALTTLEGQITYCNEAFAHMHGYQVDELMGKQIAFLHNSEQLKVVVPLLEDIKTKGGFDHTEVGRLKKDGSTFPTLMTAKLMLDNQNTPLFLSATLIDISERKKIEQEIIDLNQNLETKIQIRTKEIENTNKQLIEARIEAEKANRFKSDFLSRISHELRAPLNSILGFTQLLEMGELNAGQQKGINHILNSGKHLLELINEVLDISKIEAGKIRMSFEAVDLQNTILEVTETLFPLAKSKNVRLHIDAISTPCLVKADVQRLKQILINLTNNAIKYNKENGEVWLSFNKVMEDISPNGIIRISIKDNGTGIDQADLQRIFKPFERADQLNLNMEGTGLGLSVVKQLIDLMEGFIGVESEVGVGSTFWIELPLYFSGLMQQTISQEIEKPAVPSPKDHQPLL